MACLRIQRPAKPTPLGVFLWRCGREHPGESGGGFFEPPLNGEHLDDILALDLLAARQVLEPTR